MRTRSWRALELARAPCAPTAGPERPRRRRWVAGLSAAEGEAGLRRLARLLHEAAGAFYLDDARRRLAAHAERRAPPPELSARVAFKARAPPRTRARAACWGASVAGLPRGFWRWRSWVPACRAPPAAPSATCMRSAL